MTEQEILMLAESIRSIDEALWEIALERVFAEGLQALGWATFSLVVLGIAIYFLITGIKLLRTNIREGETAIAFTVTGGIGLVVALLGFFGSLTGAIGRFYAPAYYAAQIVLGMA